MPHPQRRGNNRPVAFPRHTPAFLLATLSARVALHICPFFTVPGRSNVARIFTRCRRRGARSVGPLPLLGRPLLSQEKRGRDESLHRNGKVLLGGVEAQDRAEGRQQTTLPLDGRQATARGESTAKVVSGCDASNDSESSCNGTTPQGWG